MKFRFLVLLVIGFVTLDLAGQKIIKNPANPESKNAGRTLIAQKVLEITDASENYFFKWPYGLKIGPDGSVYVMDKDQLLKFTPSGGFVKNFLKPGQGPGETSNVSNYIILEDNSIVIHNWAPNKIITLNTKGELISEIRLPFAKYSEFLFLDKKNYYLFRQKSPETKGTAKLIDIDKQLTVVSKENYSIREKLSFPMRVYLLNIPGEIYSMVRLVDLLSRRFKGNLFYFSHTFEYGIKLIDLDKEGIISEITREYPRVKVTEENEKYLNSGRFGFNGKTYKSPTPEYFLDILSLHVIDGKLLVFTSTVDKEKGVLVDVYDEMGKYINNFFIKFPNPGVYFKLNQHRTAVEKDTVFLIEKDEDENWMISKYKVPFTELL